MQIMSKIKEFIKNISPLNNRIEMPVILYIIKVVIIFWFVKFVSELIGEGIVIGLLFACGKNPLEGEMFDPEIMVLIMYFGYGILTGIVLLYWKLIQKKTLAQLGFKGNIGKYLAGALIGAVLVTVSTVLTVLTGAITYNGIFESIDCVFILLMLGGFVFQGAMEEVLCRGIVLQLLKGRTSVRVAIVVNTVLFIIPHLGSMTGVDAGIRIFAISNLILISVLFSSLTLRSGSILPACGLHTFWNFLLYNILGLNLSGNDTKSAAVFDLRSDGEGILNGGMYGIEASVITAAVLAAVLIIMAVMSGKKGRTDNGI